jgi:hypothetical protein
MRITFDHLENFIEMKCINVLNDFDWLSGDYSWISFVGVIFRKKNSSCSYSLEYRSVFLSRDKQIFIEKFQEKSRKRRFILMDISLFSLEIV